MTNQDNIVLQLDGQKLLIDGEGDVYRALTLAEFGGDIVYQDERWVHVTPARARDLKVGECFTYDGDRYEATHVDVDGTVTAIVPDDPGQPWALIGPDEAVQECRTN